jgi:hypothetical protein
MQNLRTEGSWRKYIMRHACPASWPDKTIWAEFYYGFVISKHTIMNLNHKPVCKVLVHR